MQLDEEIAELEVALRAKQPDFFEMQEVMQRLANIEELIKKAGLRTQKEIFASFFVRINVNPKNGQLQNR